jgi:hypothetical protein
MDVKLQRPGFGTGPLEISEHATFVCVSFAG